MLKHFALSIGLLYSATTFSQSGNVSSVETNINAALASGSSSSAKKKKLPTHFGVQVRPLIPTEFMGTVQNSFAAHGFATSISQEIGFGFGGIVRTSFTKMFALETGINFSHRSFNLNVAIPDSNIVGAQSMTFVEYDIPINALVYIQLDEKLFMNTALGVSINYKPTDTRVQIRPRERHFFTLYGFRKQRAGLDLNASIGFEYRTKESGFFYFGGSARVPFQPLFEYAAIHDFDGNRTILSGDIDGSFLSFDLKYFFPYRKQTARKVHHLIE